MSALTTYSLSRSGSGTTNFALPHGTIDWIDVDLQVTTSAIGTGLFQFELSILGTAFFSSGQGPFGNRIVAQGSVGAGAAAAAVSTISDHYFMANLGIKVDPFVSLNLITTLTASAGWVNLLIGLRT